MQTAGLQGSQDPRGEGEGEIHDCELGLTLDLKFQVCEIIWVLKFRIPKCAFWGLEIQGS